MFALSAIMLGHELGHELGHSKHARVSCAYAIPPALAFYACLCPSPPSRVCEVCLMLSECLVAVSCANNELYVHTCRSAHQPGHDSTIKWVPGARITRLASLRHHNEVRQVQGSQVLHQRRCLLLLWQFPSREASPCQYETWTDKTLSAVLRRSIPAVNTRVKVLLVSTKRCVPRHSLVVTLSVGPDAVAHLLGLDL